MHYSFATKDIVLLHIHADLQLSTYSVVTIFFVTFFYWVVNIQMNTKINFILHVLNNEVNLLKKLKINKK